MYEDHTARQMASELDRVKHYDPQYTGPLSMLDEATLYWTRRYPQLAPTQSAFAQARSRHNLAAGRDNWPNILTTAQELANAFRPLGDAALTFCTEQSVHGWGCTGVLSDDGRCPYASDHAN